MIYTYTLFIYVAVSIHFAISSKQTNFEAACEMSLNLAKKKI